MGGPRRARAATGDWAEGPPRPNVGPSRGPPHRMKEAAAPTAETARDGDTLSVTLRGAWTTGRIDRRAAGLSGVSADGARHARLDIAAVEAMDTAGAWLVYQTIKHLREAGVEVALEGKGTVTAGLIETVARHDRPYPPPPEPENPLVALVLRVGRGTVDVAEEARDLVNFLGLTLIVLVRLLLKPWRLRPVALFSQMERSGLNALPIVGLISFLVGVVLAYQGADQLARFGAQIFTVNLVGIGVLREMGILLTAIIVAGRSGSAYTAQIGTMKVNEEIDAMVVLGLDPVEILVVPRIVGLMLVMPLLAFYADIMGLAGGAVMAMATLDISLFQFVRQVNTAVPIWSFWVGIIKAPIFAFVIALVGCYEGLKVSRSAESVGRQTTRSVVESIFLVIVLDAGFSILFSVLGV